MKNEIDHIRNTINDNFSNYIKNKTIAIIGPAETLKDSNLGGYIDSFDITRRFNTVIEYMPFKEEIKKDYGSNTHILDITYPHIEKYLKRNGDYTIFKSTEKWKKAGSAKELFLKSLKLIDIIRLKTFNNNFIKEQMTSDKDKNFIMNKTSFLDNKLTINFFKNRFIDKNKKILNPRTGFLAIIDSLLNGASKIFIGGMTFYHGGGHVFRELDKNIELTPTSDHMGNDISLLHDSRKEILFLKELIKLYPDIFILDDFLKKLLIKK